jgi:hypothetical protein
MYQILPLRRFDVEMIIGVDSEGFLIQLQNHHLASYEPPSIFRPTLYSATLIVGSIRKALKGGNSHQNFDFVDPNKVSVSGYFDEAENDELGKFKRVWIKIEDPSSNRLYSGYLLVLREEEMQKLHDILVNTFDIQL